MADTIGDLVVQITTDLSGFVKGMQEVNERVANAEKAVKQSTGKILEYTGKIGMALTGAGAAITAVYGVMVKSSMNLAESLYTVNQRTGVAVETLSELKYVAEQTESSFEAVAYSLKFLARNMYEAETGNFKLKNAFNDFGIEITDANGKLLESNKVFMQLADKFSRMEDGAAKTGIAIQLLGRGGEQIIPVLNLGSEGIKKLADEAHRLKTTLTTENVKALDEFGDKIDSMQKALGGLWLQISLTVLPTLEKYVKKITEAVVKLREWGDRHPELSKNMAELILQFGLWAGAIGVVIMAIEKLTKVLLFFNTVITAAGVGVFKAGGLFTSMGILIKNVNLLYPAVILIGTAFAAWNIGKIIGDIEWVKNILSGENGWFTNFFRWWDAHFGKKEVTRELTPIPVDLGKVSVTKPKEKSESTQSESTQSESTQSLLDQHNQSLQELNDKYVNGKISMEEYYNSMQKLSSDGINRRQMEVSSVQSLISTLQSFSHTAASTMFDFLNMALQKFSAGMSQAITSIIMGTKKASEAFKDFGKMMIEAIINFVVEYAIQAIIAMTIGKLLMSFVGAQASAIAAMWMPAAILASIATFGAAAAVGTGAVGGALASGIGMLATAKTASAMGSGASGGVTTMAEGGSGIVDKPTLFLAGEAGPERYNFTPVGKESNQGASIQINFYDTKINSDVDVDNLSEQIGNEVERKLRGVG